MYQEDTFYKRLQIINLAVFFCLTASQQGISQQPFHQHKFFSNTINRASHGPALDTSLKETLNFLIAAQSRNSAGIISHFTITGSINITVVSTGTTCGESNGAFVITASGGTPPYQYSENGYPFQSSNTFTQKAPGLYNIIVQDATGLTTSTSVTLINTYSPPLLTFSTYNATSSGSAFDAGITLVASGGTPPYQYSLDGVHYQASNIFSGLSAGDYLFTVMDANGCFYPQPFSFGTFTGGAAFTYSYSLYLCNSDVGFLDFTVTDWPSPVQYSIDGIHYQDNGYFNVVGAGLHHIYMKRSDGNVFIYCVTTFPYCGIGVAAITTNATCGHTDGSISAIGRGGTIPYTYSIDGINFQSDSIFNGLAPGIYTLTIKDQQEETSTLKAIVFSDCPSVAATIINSTCGQPNGAIVATGSSGTSPYRYSIDGVHFTSNNTFTGLNPGPYTLTLEDADNLTTSQVCNVANICVTVAATSVDATCGNSNGTILAVGAGGSPPYQYSIGGANFQTSGSFAGLQAATYLVTIRDAGGQVNTVSISVGNQVGPSLTANVTNASCLDKNGEVEVVAVGGAPPLQFDIDGGKFQTDPNFSAPIGSHIAQVKDAKGCLASQQINIPLTNSLTLDPGMPVNICQGSTASMNATSNANAYSWSPALGLDNALLSNPKASPDTTTKYYVTVTSGICQKTDSVIVSVNEAPIPQAVPDTSICFGQSVQLNGSGGLSYIWSPVKYLDHSDISNPIVNTPKNTITYHLAVIDQKGCHSLQDANVTITVTPPAKLFAGNDTALLINQPLPLQTVDVDKSGFSDYSWSPATGLDNAFISNPIARLSESITYTVVGTTPNGCQGSASIAVKVFSMIDLFVPNAFTPNGDGHNDILRVLPVGIRDFKYFSVFNRSGQRIFYTGSQAQGWDGTINGRRQDSGVYVWMAAGIDYNGNPIERKGVAILIR